MPNPTRIFLDTNVFIIGAALADSPEAMILKWAGFAGESVEPVEIIVSDALFGQILRVAKRVQGKDWGGEILARIWQGMNVQYVLLDERDIQALVQKNIVPREDVEIYLTAKAGKAECFISANRELIRVLARESGAFECLDAAEFVSKYIH
jgi:predicted nucleic acid-binding protein